MTQVLFYLSFHVTYDLVPLSCTIISIVVFITTIIVIIFIVIIIVLFNVELYLDEVGLANMADVGSF